MRGARGEVRGSECEEQNEQGKRVCEKAMNVCSLDAVAAREDWEHMDTVAGGGIESNGHCCRLTGRVSVSASLSLSLSLHVCLSLSVSLVLHPCVSLYLCVCDSSRHPSLSHNQPNTPFSLSLLFSLLSKYLSRTTICRRAPSRKMGVLLVRPPSMMRIPRKRGGKKEGWVKRGIVDDAQQAWGGTCG